MSVRAIEFVNQWIFDNVDALSYPQENAEEAGILAASCVSDAQKAGISKEEIEEDMGNIIACILEAMSVESHAEEVRLQSKSR